jgi:hypothetical protein
LRDFEKDHKNVEEKMPSCDDCGLMFENILDLARHMNRWCPENNDLKGKRDDDEDDNIPWKCFYMIPKSICSVHFLDLECFRIYLSLSYLLLECSVLGL